jgi:hypothetical protein
MDIAKVQTALDNVGIVVGEFGYLAKSSTVSNVNFDNISSAADIEVAQSGMYSFAKLTSAKNIALGSNYSSKVAGVSMPLLKTVTSFTTGSITEGTTIVTGADYVGGPAVNHKISFTKANSIDVNSLVRYGAALELGVDEGGTVGITALDDVDATGAQSNISLTVEGPSTLTIENFKDGTLSFKNVGEVVVNNFEGPFTLNAGVVSFKADKAMSVSTASATDLEVFEITGITDPDDATDKEGPAIAFDSNSNIKIIKLKGKIDSVVLNNNSDLEEAHTTAEVSGQIQITNNSSLIAVNTKDSKASGVKISGNSDLEAVNIETQTIDTTEDTDTKVDGTYEVTNNASLLKTTISSNKIASLTITGNDDMTEIDLTGMSTLGDTTTGRSISIFANDLTASRATDSNDAVASGLATDEGTFSESAGMKTAKIIADKMVADTAASVYIYFDTVETFQGENGVAETNDHQFLTSAVAAGIPTYSSQPQQTVVAHRGASTAVAGKAAIAAKRSFHLNIGTANPKDAEFDLGVNNAQIISTAVGTANLVSDNAQVNVNAIVNTASLAQADAAGISISATKYASPEISIVFSENDPNDENSAATVKALASGAQVWVDASDTLTLTIAGDTAAVVSGTAITTRAGVADALALAFNDVNSDDDLRNWTVDSSVAGTLKFTARDIGTSQIGAALTLGFTVASAARSNLGYAIHNGYDGVITPAIVSDNVARGKDYVVTITADTPGTALAETGQVAVSTAGAGAARKTAIRVDGTGVALTELTNSFRNNLTLTTTDNPTEDKVGGNVYPTQSRSDVAYAEDLIAGSVDTATKFDRTGWLAD